MQFFLILMFVWFIQCGESVITRTEFKFNTSIYDGDNVIYRPHSSDQGYNLFNYPEELCNWLFLALPKNLTRKDVTTEQLCTAIPFTTAVNHTREWGITIKLVTATPEGQLINLTCPTFVGLFEYFLEKLTPYFSRGRLQFDVHSYYPPSIPYNPPMARDVEIKVNAFMCDRDFKPIPVKETAKYNQTFLANEIKNTHYVNLGYPLVTASEVMINRLSKLDGVDRTFLNFELKLPKAYAQSLHINPYCDTAKILEMILVNAQAKAAFFLCGVTAEVVPPPTEKPTTVKPTTTKTTTATETTALASTTKRPMEMLVCAFIMSQLLANF